MIYKINRFKFFLLLILIFIPSVLLYNAQNISTPENIEGFWNLTCESPFVENSKLHFYVTFKKINNNIVVDIQRKGGFLIEKGVPVKISGTSIVFSRMVNDWKYQFKGQINSEKSITGKFDFYENNNLKGNYKFNCSKIPVTEPVADVSGEWIISSRKNYKLTLKADKNKLTGFFTLPDGKKYNVRGTIIYNEIALVRYGYDWYEIYIAKTNNNGKTFRGNAIYSDKRVVVFTLAKPMPRMPQLQPPVTRPEPPVVKFKPPLVNGWKPTIKSKWGGWIILERGRRRLWWIDSLGIAHPIAMKALLKKYGESVVNINFAPRNTKYIDKLKIGIKIDRNNSPEKVRKKIWIDTQFSFNPGDGIVIRERGTSKNWFLYNSKAHCIMDNTVLKKYWGDTGIVKIVPYGFLNRYELGPNIIN